MVIYMKIGVSTREIISNIGYITNGIPFTYLSIFNKKHYPMFIDSSLKLTKENKKYLLEQIKDLDGFILPGGEKISEVDLFLIDHCYKNNIPLLGICLGMQEIGYYFNDKTIKKLDTDKHFNLKLDYAHSIKLKRKGYLYNLLNTDKIYVNSRHNYHIQENKNYTIEAKCKKIIEAIKVKNTPYILGVQFHPEMMCEYDDNAKILLNDFIKACELNSIQKNKTD